MHPLAATARRVGAFALAPRQRRHVMDGAHEGAGDLIAGGGDGKVTQVWTQGLLYGFNSSDGRLVHAALPRPTRLRDALIAG